VRGSPGPWLNPGTAEAVNSSGPLTSSAPGAHAPAPMHLRPLPPPPAAQCGPANREAAAEGWGFHPGGALGIELVIVHGCLPSASSQRCRCQSTCERRQPGFLSTRWRPGLSRPPRLIANSVERLIASWAQRSSVVSQGFEGDMAAGAAGD